MKKPLIGLFAAALLFALGAQRLSANINFHNSTGETVEFTYTDEIYCTATHDVGEEGGWGPWGTDLVFYDNYNTSYAVSSSSVTVSVEPGQDLVLADGDVSYSSREYYEEVPYPDGYSYRMGNEETWTFHNYY